jgi:DNA primase
VPSDPVELTKQIKAANDIVVVVGGYLALKPAGNVSKCLCPFHNDSNPSLTIDPKWQNYKCWACGAAGDVFKFVMHMEKVGFAEARLLLANRAGIKLDEKQSPQDQARVRLLSVMRWAQEKYAHCLLESPIGAGAVAYIASRKLSGRTVRDFGLGYAPLDGSWLVNLAMDEDVPLDALVEVGLIGVRDENRGYYDRFRDRVMFPIRDVQKRPIAFGGRIMPDSPYASRAPKYYNSAETPLFSKSDVLYGIDLARHPGGAAGYLAVVEGYTDVMMAHQCGVPQVVATMGTALNARHVAQLRRYVPKVVLVYDADAGGFSGVDRALDIFVSQDAELSVATLPDGLDPCDLLVRPGGLDTFKQVLTSATDALEFKLNQLLERDPNPSVEVTRRIIDEILGIIAAAPPMPSKAAQVKRELMVTRLSHRLGVRHETIWARLRELQIERKQAELKQGPRVMPSAARTTDAPTEKSGPAVTIERQLIGLLLGDMGLIPVAAKYVTPERITHPGLRRILGDLYALQAATGAPDMEQLRARLHDKPDLYDYAETKLRVAGQTMGKEPSERLDWLMRIVAGFDRMAAEAEQRAVREQLKAAPEGDAALELLRKLDAQNKKRKRPPEGDAA